MELSHEFEVSVPVEEAWAILTDLERIAPCLPGATLDEIEGPEHRGRVKVKVGPITAQYKGTARIVEQDDEAHVALVEASGRDTRGQGNASASIKAELNATDGGGTHVSVLTDLSITGKVAQFGRGVMADVSNKLLGQFVENLETMVLAGSVESDIAEALAEVGEQASAADESAAVPADVSGNGAGGSTAPAGVRRIEGPEAAPVDLLDAAGSPVLKRALPLFGLAVSVLVVVGLVRRRRRRRA